MIQVVDAMPEPVPIVGGHLPQPGRMYIVSLRSSADTYEGHVLAHSATEAMVYLNYVRRRTPNVKVKVKRFVG